LALEEEEEEEEEKEEEAEEEEEEEEEEYIKGDAAFAKVARHNSDDDRQRPPFAKAAKSGLAEALAATDQSKQYWRNIKADKEIWLTTMMGKHCFETWSTRTSKKVAQKGHT
jgi:hypothetical protein